MQNLLRSLLTFSVFLSLALAAAAQSPAAEFRLTILHTNDLHGHIFPFAYTETGRSPQEKADVGGAARRATLIRRLRKTIKNPVILVDAGDTFTRGPLTNAYEGIADIEAMNALGYEMAAVGNNEFKAKDGTEVNDAAGAQNALLQAIKRSRFPWLCANTLDGKGAIIEGVQPYIVREIQGVRVGFLGLTAPRSAQYPQTKGWTIADPIAVAKEWIPKVRRNCDILIALTHLGVDLDKQLAAQTRGIDVIVGGDSHTFLYKAEEVANLDGRKIPIVQDGEFGVNLGRFDLRFAQASDGIWTLAQYKYELIPVDAKIKEARDVAALLEPYLKPMLTVIGTLENIGETSEERTRITNQVIVEAMRQQTGADYALNPRGSGMFDVFRHSRITRYDVFAILPFKNNVVMIDLTGAEIQALHNTVQNTVIAGDTTRLQPATRYKVAFIDFSAKSGYKLSDAKWTNTKRDVRDVIMAYLSRGKTASD